MYIFGLSWLPVYAIVVYPFVLFSEAQDEVHPDIMRHELVHVGQINRDGWFPFYFRYVNTYLSCRWSTRQGHQFCYATNPAEIEANYLESKPQGFQDFAEEYLIQNMGEYNARIRELGSAVDGDDLRYR